MNEGVFEQFVCQESCTPRCLTRSEMESLDRKCWKAYDGAADGDKGRAAAECLSLWRLLFSIRMY